MKSKCSEKQNEKETPTRMNLVCAGVQTDLAAFTRAPPGSPQRGAALRLQGGTVDVDLTAAVLYRQPAGALHTVCGAKVTKGFELVTFLL